MDPNACLQRIIDALVSDRGLDAIDAHRDLCAWLKSGGFAPRRFTADPALHATCLDGLSALNRALVDRDYV